MGKISMESKKCKYCGDSTLKNLEECKNCDRMIRKFGREHFEQWIKRIKIKYSDGKNT